MKSGKRNAAFYLGIGFIGLMIVGLSSCWSLYLSELERRFPVPEAPFPRHT